MDKEEEKVVLDNEHEEIALDTDILLNLALGILDIEYALRKSLSPFRANYDVYLRYRCDEFDTQYLTGCGIIFDLYFRNRKNDCKDNFSIKLLYSDILLNNSAVEDKVTMWLNEHFEYLNFPDEKGE